MSEPHDSDATGLIRNPDETYERADAKLGDGSLEIPRGSLGILEPKRTVYVVSEEQGGAEQDWVVVGVFSTLGAAQAHIGGTVNPLFEIEEWVIDDLDSKRPCSRDI